jgi:hypothetical protein
LIITISPPIDVASTGETGLEIDDSDRLGYPEDRTAVEVVGAAVAYRSPDPKRFWWCVDMTGADMGP